MNLQETNAAHIVKNMADVRTSVFLICIGCFDRHWGDWRNCRKALQGMMVGKDDHVDVRMEVMCLLYLSTISYKIGLNDTIHNLNISENSTYIFSRLSLSGEYPLMSSVILI